MNQIDCKSVIVKGNTLMRKNHYREELYFAVISVSFEETT